MPTTVKTKCNIVKMINMYDFLNERNKARRLLNEKPEKQQIEMQTSFKLGRYPDKNLFYVDTRGTFNVASLV